jgi:hypothetical protein
LNKEQVMIPAIRVTGGSVHFPSGGGWIELDALDDGEGTSAAGNVMLTNATADIVYFAFSANADGATPGFTPAAGSLTITGDIPVGPNDSIIVSMPDSTGWWGASGELDVTPCEVINT